MNERIEKLWDEAADSIAAIPNGRNNFWETQENFMEKFAELIVRECSKIIVNGGYRNPALGEKHSLTPPEIATMIQEHFGVEE